MKLLSGFLILISSHIVVAACPSLKDTHLQWGHFLEKSSNNSNNRFRILRLKKNTYVDSLRIYFSDDPELTKFGLNLEEERMGRLDYAACFIKSSFSAPDNVFHSKDNYIDISASSLEIELLSHLLNQEDRYKVIFDGRLIERSMSPLTLSQISLRYLKMADRKIESHFVGSDLILELAKAYDVINPKYTKRVLLGLKYPLEDKINLRKLPSRFERGYDGIIDYLTTSTDANAQIIMKLLKFNPHSLRSTTSSEQERVIYGYLYLLSLKKMSPGELGALLRPL